MYIYIHVQQYIHQCTLIYLHIHWCTLMYVNTRWYTLIYTNIHEYMYIYKNIDMHKMYVSMYNSTLWYIYVSIQEYCQFFSSCGASQNLGSITSEAHLTYHFIMYWIPGQFRDFAMGRALKLWIPERQALSPVKREETTATACAPVLSFTPQPPRDPHRRVGNLQ